VRKLESASNNRQQRDWRSNPPFKSHHAVANYYNHITGLRLKDTFINKCRRWSAATFRTQPSSEGVYRDDYLLSSFLRLLSQLAKGTSKGKMKSSRSKNVLILIQTGFCIQCAIVIPTIRNKNVKIEYLAIIRVWVNAPVYGIHIHNFS
jgi:hypothetical protein